MRGRRGTAGQPAQALPMQEPGQARLGRGMLVVRRRREPLGRGHARISADAALPRPPCPGISRCVRQAPTYRPATFSQPRRPDTSSPAPRQGCALRACAREGASIPLEPMDIHWTYVTSPSRFRKGPCGRWSLGAGRWLSCEARATSAWTREETTARSRSRRIDDPLTGRGRHSEDAPGRSSWGPGTGKPTVPDGGLARQRDLGIRAGASHRRLPVLGGLSSARSSGPATVVSGGSARVARAADRTPAPHPCTEIAIGCP